MKIISFSHNYRYRQRKVKRYDAVPVDESEQPICDEDVKDVPSSDILASPVQNKSKNKN